MGGYGSGRTGSTQKAENCRSIDVNKMHCNGCLKLGWRGNWVWSVEGQEVARINCEAVQGRIILNYNVRQNGSDWEPIEQPVRLSQANCNYGGTRPYFICSGIVSGRHCERRVCKLFAGGRYFLCRHCYRISYNSQSEARHDRMLRRANKLRGALGGEAGTSYFIAPKPKEMLQRTYQRKRFEIEWCENQANQLFLSKYAHLLSKEVREVFFDA